MGARRRRGEGSIRQRPNGLWEGTLTIPGASPGTQRRRAVYGRSLTEVRAKLQALQQQLAEGMEPPDQRLTVAGWCSAWVEQVVERLRPSTLTRYRQLVAQQIIPTWGRVRLAQLTPSGVERGLRQLTDGGLSPRTASHARAVLRAALSDAQREGLLARNVASLAKPPRVAREAPKVLTPSEAWAVIDAMPDPGVQRLVAVAVNTGLRQGELLGLRWGDVDWEARELHVTQALQRAPGEYRLVEVKSASSRRTVPLTGDAVVALENQRRWQVEARLGAGRRWREPIPGLVFTTNRGQPLNGTSLTHRFEDALQAAGLPVIRWHHLRHAFAGLMLGSGSDLATVSGLLGHSSVSLTASTYAGLMPSLKRAAADRLGLLLQRPSG